MRQIGTLDDPRQATLFSDYLTAQGVSAHVEEENDRWIVWIKDEDQLIESRQSLAAFLENPNDPKYEGSKESAEKIRAERQRRRIEAARNTIDVRRNIFNQPLARRAPLTMVLIAACVVVAVLTHVGQNQTSVTYRSLAFCDPVHQVDPEWRQTKDGLVDIVGRAQVWRLLTPAFLHFSIMHIVFNLIWLYSLGGQIESRLGTPALGLLALVSALAGNVGEYFFTGPWFGGMSGVVYGLLGFLWIRQQILPGDGLRLARETIIIMLAWLVAGFVGVLELAFHIQVANWAHLFGLLAGVGLAYAIPPRRGRSAS